MAVQLGLSDSPAAHDLGIRRGPDRRQAERRASPRSGRDRRRGDRRRKTFSSLIFSLLTVAFPAQVNLGVLRTQIPLIAMKVLPSARVAVSIDSFTPVPPRQAYEGLIKEAAKRYRVEPRLIRSVMQTESAFNPVAVSSAGTIPSRRASVAKPSSACASVTETYTARPESFRWACSGPTPG